MIQVRGKPLSSPLKVACDNARLDKYIRPTPQFLRVCFRLDPRTRNSFVPEKWQCPILPTWQHLLSTPLPQFPWQPV